MKKTPPRPTTCFAAFLSNALMEGRANRNFPTNKIIVNANMGILYAIKCAKDKPITFSFGDELLGISKNTYRATCVIKEINPGIKDLCIA